MTIDIGDDIYDFNDQQAFVDAMFRAVAMRVAERTAGNLEGSYVAQEQLLAAYARRAAATGVAMPLLDVFDRLGLSEGEQRVIWILAAHEFDRSVRAAIRTANTEDTADPTADTIRRLGYDDRAIAIRELGSKGRLRHLSLIERTDNDERCPEHRQTFTLASWLAALVSGVDSIADEVADLRLDAEHVVDRHDLVVASSAVTALEAAFSASELVVVVGRVGVGKRSMIVNAARERRQTPLEIDCRKLPADPVAAARQLTAIARDCSIHQLLPVLCHLHALEGRSDLPERVGLIETCFDGLVLATAAHCPARRWKRPPRVIDVAQPTRGELAQLWHAAFPEISRDDAAMLATLYPLSPALIQIATRAVRRDLAGTQVTMEALERGVRSVVDDRLAGLANRVNVTQTWGDLVLPEEQAMSIMELIARIRQRSTVYETWGFADKIGRGLGVTALLSGPPGTGKTMAAGLVARDLGISLYRVDLSKIVSKWIGETERNLSQLFDAAEAGHAMLLFDECDALFGKRSEVKSSNDRHANQEVNYLLQRLESFEGICILTTNHEQAIDDAFRRRLSVHVRFDLPDIEERKLLWRTMIPAVAPTNGDLDLDRLAERYVMSGGYIRNAVLRAAFLAADSTGVIGATLLARAAQLEYESMGKVAPRM